MENKFLIVYDRLKKLRFNEHVLCKEFWLKIEALKENFNEKDCWELMTDNIQWLLNGSKVFKTEFDTLTTDEIKEWFSEDVLNANGIYTTGTHKVMNGRFIGLGKAKLQAYGHSEVILFNNAYSECYDTTFVKGYNDSIFVVNDCIGHAFDNCTVEANGLSIVENWTENAVVSGRKCVIVNRSKSNNNQINKPSKT